MTNASPTIAECLVENCVVVDSDYDGGGLYIYRGAPRLRDCTLRGNWASDDGGGIRCKQASAQIEDCLIEDNSAWSSGGGLYVDGGSTATVSRTVFRWNSAWGADGGGGIRVSEAATVLELRDSVLQGNFAAHSGGGLFAHNASTVTVVGCTMLDNQASVGASAIDTATAATVAATNTLFSRNTGTTLGAAVTNLVACFTNAAPAVVAGGWRLLPGSSCIDAGTNLAWMAAAVDIDGEPRLGNGVVDIGADEWHDTDGDSLPDAWEWLHFGHLTRDGTGDADEDGLTEAGEYAAGLDPLVEDSEWDVFSALYPTDPDVQTNVFARGWFGDTAGSSHSERYALRLTPLGLTSNILEQWQNESYGQATLFTGVVERGHAYTFNLRWYAHDPAATNHPAIDHDYQWYIESASEGTGWTWFPRYALADTNLNSEVYSPYDTLDDSLAGKGHLGDHWVDAPTWDCDFGATVGAGVTNGPPGKWVDLYVPLVDLDPADASNVVVDAWTGEGVAPGTLLVTGELRRVRFVRGPESMPTGTVQLAIAAGGDLIRVWSDPAMGAGDLVLSADAASTNWVLSGPSTWAGIPTNLWVEAITNSATAGDIALAARFLSPSGALMCADTNVFTVFRVEMVDSDLIAEPDFDAVTNSVGKLWIQGGAQWAATIKVSPWEAKDHVDVRLLQTIQGAMKRVYRTPPPGGTGSKTDTGAVWHFDGSSETADWTDIGAFYQLVNGDTPILIDDPADWSSMELDLRFEVFIQYRIALGPWVTLEKGTWYTEGVGEARPDGGGGYAVDGTIVNTVTSGFGASSDSAVESPKWEDLGWEDY